MAKGTKPVNATAGTTNKNASANTAEATANEAAATKKSEATANEAAATKKPEVRTSKTVIEGNPIVKIDKKEYEIKTPLFNVSGFGTFTNKEAATNEALLRHLLEMGSSVLKEVF